MDNSIDKSGTTCDAPPGKVKGLAGALRSRGPSTAGPGRRRTPPAPGLPSTTSGGGGTPAPRERPLLGVTPARQAGRRLPEPDRSRSVGAIRKEPLPLSVLSRTLTLPTALPLPAGISATAAQASAAPTPAAAPVVATSVGPGSEPAAIAGAANAAADGWGGYQNGYIAASAVCPVPWQTVDHLRAATPSRSSWPSTRSTRPSSAPTSASTTPIVRTPSRLPSTRSLARPSPRCPARHRLRVGHDQAPRHHHDRGHGEDRRRGPGGVPVPAGRPTVVVMSYAGSARTLPSAARARAARRWRPRPCTCSAASPVHHLDHRGHAAHQLDRGREVASRYVRDLSPTVHVTY